MKIADITLQVARDICEHYTGVATAGTTTSITDSAMQFQAGLFNGGTLWITSGTYAGIMRKIISYSNGVITWGTALAGAPPAGVTFMVADAKFPIHLLRACVNAILADYPLEKQDTTLTVDIDNNGEYALPAGVSNILTVELATEDSSPYKYIPNYTWRELNGVLNIYDQVYDYQDGYKIRLTYHGKHGEVDDGTALNGAVDCEYLRYAAEAWIWRNYIQKLKKDDPLATDLMNEVKFLEAMRKSVTMKPNRVSVRPIRMAGYPGF